MSADARAAGYRGLMNRGLVGCAAHHEGEAAVDAATASSGACGRLTCFAGQICSALGSNGVVLDRKCVSGTD